MPILVFDVDIVYFVGKVEPYKNYVLIYEDKKETNATSPDASGKVPKLKPLKASWG